MISCLCACVNEDVVKKAIENGAVTIKDLQEQLDVCNYCMRCEPHLMQLLQNTEGTSEAD